MCLKYIDIATELCSSRMLVRMATATAQATDEKVELSSIISSRPYTIHSDSDMH